MHILSSMFKLADTSISMKPYHSSCTRTLRHGFGWGSDRTFIQARQHAPTSSHYATRGDHRRELRQTFYHSVQHWWMEQRKWPQSRLLPVSGDRFSTHGKVMFKLAACRASTLTSQVAKRAVRVASQRQVAHVAKMYLLGPSSQ